MSIQQGLISPPLSGRTDKADHPRIQDVHKRVDAAHVFGRALFVEASDHQAQVPPYQHQHVHHTIRSPVKKHHDNLSDAERAERPLTPPMSKDVRHDQEIDIDIDYAGHHRAGSEDVHLNIQANSAAVATHNVSADAGAVGSSCYRAPAVRAGLMAAAPIRDRFHTLNQGVAFESDNEHNPFLDRRSSAASTSKSTAPSAVQAHHSHPYYDEFDSDQDAEGSVHEDGLDRDFDSEVTPRASSSQATTPPPVRGRALSLRPARPFSERARVDNEPVTSTVPIRDTPKNPFLAGGPADNGFHGPNGHVAYRRARQIPGKERGKIAYVFRGQRVTYADPEYDSEDDDSDMEDSRARTNEFNPHYNTERPPRLQPRLLFPPNASISSTQAAHRNARPTASLQASSAQSSSGRRGHALSAPLPRAVDLMEDKSRGATSSSSYDEEEHHAPRTGGGLFAAQIAEQRKQQMAAPSQQLHGTMAPSSSARLQGITRDSHAVATGSEGRHQSARDALLARLDQTNWSDDDEEDHSEDDRESSHGGRWGREHSESRVMEDERLVERHQLSRSQSHCKRLSDELQRGHSEEVDVLGRPMKRSRASYAY